MKITEAIWEKRNLGLLTLEIEVEKNDSLGEVINSLASLNYEYLVVKLPVNKPEFIHELQNFGLKFNEILYSTQFSKSQLPELSNIELRMSKEIEYVQILDSEISQLFERLDEDIFETDRIALNPEFGKTVASRRYKGLITDEIASGAKLFYLKFRGHAIGFFLWKMELKKSVSHLAGVFKEYKNRGFGIYLNYFQLMHSLMNEVVSHKSVYSSNNLGAERIHKHLGYDIIKSDYIFTNI